MLIHGFNSHYRNLQKKLFLGETFRVFADPKTPAEDIDMATMPANLSEAAKRKSEFTREMEEVVPEKITMQPQHDSTEMQEEWNALLGRYNAIQSTINYLLKRKKELQDPKTVANDPAFRAKYQQIYQDMVSVEALRYEGLNESDVDWADLRTKLADQANMRTSVILEDVQTMIDGLVMVRRQNLEVVMERVKRDFARRINHLKEQWRAHPPHGYEQVSGEWTEYCDNVIKVINELPEFDSTSPKFPEKDDPDHPGASEVYKTMKEWAAYLDSLEDSYELFSQGQNHELSIKKLEDRYKVIDKERKKIINGDFNSKINREIDEVLGPLNQLIGEIESRLGPEPTDPHDKEAESDDVKNKRKELEGLKKTVKNLEGSKNVEAAFKEAFESEDVLLTAQRAGRIEALPKGLKGQIDFIKKMPFSEEERRHMMFRLNESLDRAQLEIKGAEEYYKTTLPAMLQRIRVYQDQLAQKPKGAKFTIMWLPAKGTFDEMSHTVTDLFERSYKRDTGRKAGIFGREVFKPLSKIKNPPELLKPITEISGAMDIHREHAETEDYQNWMKHHEHASFEHMFHVMHDTNNRFEFRAVVELLAKKGRMRFNDDEGFFRQLNKFQQNISVPVNKYWHLEKRPSSQEVIRKAINGIYQDPEIYRSWVTQNASGIESEKGNKMKTLGELSEDKDGLKGKIQGILTEYIEDKKDPHKHFSEADPVEYEAVLTYAIDQGKLDAEDVLYFLIQGIGHGLLALERGSEYTGKNNNYPAIEIFASETKRGPKPTLEDLEEWSKMSYDHYYYWYHSHVMYLPKVQQRLNKALTQGIRLDHDYFTAFAGYASGKTLETLLAQSNDGYRLQSTAIQNGTLGRLMAFDTLMENLDGMGADGTRALSDFVSASVVFDGILNNKMHQKEGSRYFRLDQAAKMGYPRYKDQYNQFYGRGGNTTMSNLQVLRDRLIELDFDKTEFPLLRKLFNGEFKDDAQAADFGRRMMARYPGIFGDNQEPKGIDDLFQYVGAYMDYVIKNHSAVVKALKRSVTHEHNDYYAERQAAGKKAIPDMIAETNEAQKGYRDEVSERAIKNQLVTDPHAHGHGHGAHGHGAHGAHGAHHGEHGGHDEHHEGGEHPEEGGEGGGGGEHH